MELTLNLLWLLLTVPAISLWLRANSEGARTRRDSLRCLLILAAVLAVLFPVVSATDDLQMMRPEVEETGTRDAPGSPHQGKFSASLDDSGQPFALLATPFRLLPVATVWSLAIQTPVVAPAVLAVTTRSGRAPPSSYLA